MPVKKKINLKKYTKTFVTAFSVSVALAARDAAIQRVRVDTGKLKISIKAEIVGSNKYIVRATAPHALVQEYGHPRHSNYGFTPYMRPAVVEATSSGVLATLGAEAHKIALGASLI